MTLRSIRAVGDPVSLSTLLGKTASNDIDFLDDGHFYGSGTEALGAACADACQSVKAPGTLPGPSIIVPGYTCPDVVSAVEFAGAKAVFCDLEKDSPRVDLGRLRALLRGNPAAVVLTSFMGLGENTAAVRELISNGETKIIYDVCQSRPDPGAIDYDIDYVVHSFGRGKPTSVLGGGWLGGKAGCVLTPPEPIASGASAVKVLAYNIAISPLVYSWVRRLPGLEIGETRFLPLTTVRRLANIAKQRAKAASSTPPAHLHKAKILQSYRRTLPLEMDLAAKLNADSELELLRFPVLLPSKKARDNAFFVLDRLGMGGSRMYRSALPDIAGISTEGQEIDVPNARDFSDRLLTLPIHTGVSVSDADAISRILTESLNRSA